MSLAVEAVRLRKTYRRTVVVADLTLEVARGEVFGFLGPNGAGKTTTVKMLLGLARPSGGTVRLLGRPAGDLEARRRVGFLPELFRFHGWLTGAECLRFHGRLHGLRGPELERRVDEALGLVGLGERGGERLGGYSKGMQQRLGLAQALVNRPELVFLDEPTSALDPIGRREVRSIIGRLKEEGVTVFLNSHLLGEVELTCDRVAIVDRGRVVREGPLADLLAPELETELRVDRVTPELLAAIAPHVRVLSSDGPTLRLGLEGEERLPLVAAAVIASGARLYALSPRRESLEELFVRLVSGGEG